jgi:pyruvate dehydrogenase E2 component (dihydrolipoamide acetyltransferase)
MPIPITMPRLSDTMQEGTLVKWRVKVGDPVKSGDLLADVETDKATMELQAFDDGTVARLAVAEGQTTAVGQVILVLAAAGETVEAAAQAAVGGVAGGAAAADQPQAQAAGQPAEDGEDGGVEAAGAAAGGRVRVSPLARKIAEDRGVDLAKVRGTGPGGRIIKRDVLAAAAKPQADRKSVV